MRAVATLLAILLTSPVLAGCLEGGAAPGAATDAPESPIAWRLDHHDAPSEGESGDGAGGEPPGDDAADAVDRGGDADVASVTSTPSEYPPCEHPWPCGDGSEWPEGLEGPFELAEVREVTVESFDGVALHGWLLLPDLPEGVAAPVVLFSSPYWGESDGRPDLPEHRRELATVFPIEHLVGAGYAVAAFSVRGTGNSGGCFDLWGPSEQRDQAVLVEWLAAQEWSNGRVAMMGLSYHSATALAAAVQRPAALKTVVVSGLVSDVGLYFHSPQGAAYTAAAVGAAALAGVTSVKPPQRGVLEDPAHATVDHAPVAPERACAEVARVLAAARDAPTDARDAEFFAARRFVSQFPDVTAAVLLAHGFRDHWNPHSFQEDAAWRALERAPKWQLEGQWGHAFPGEGADHPRWVGEGWNRTVTQWLDFWLKGAGHPPERLGVVDYQDAAGAWRASTTWPPAEARLEALYLTPRGLTTHPDEGAARFRAAPPAANRLEGGNPRDHLLCAPAAPGGAATAAVFTSAPLGVDVTVAGNPLALLQLESDQPGGLVSLHLYDLAPDFHCDDAGRAVGARALTTGAADLRFHRGNAVGEDFPTGEATAVRVDLFSVAEPVPAGHRLAVVASYGDPVLYAGQPYAPNVTLHGGLHASASHVVLPLVEGTVGGGAPLAAYPPRPFAAHP